MKTKAVALSLLLLAGTAGAALSQEAGDREPRGRVGPSDGGARAVGRGVYQRPERPPPEARQAPEARSAPVAPGARGAGAERRRGGDGERRGRGERPREADLRVRPEGRGVWVDREGDADSSGLTGADRQDHEDRTEARDWRRWNEGDRDWDRGRGDRRDGERRDGDRRDGHRPDTDRRDGDRRDRGGGWDHRDRDHRDADRRWGGDRDRRGPPANHPRWDRRRYPPVYTSGHRYRGHIWRRPSGFYVHAWSLGEVLPRGWYDEPYRLMDWWNYALPMPPPGYDWVRVGYDAVLVDRWSGRVLQVVRLVFW
ncbi:RcnB family protein [Phenylobacterium sp.]|jgi:Ni/Co efflux regulator RcnB|uniref:RcnB family protein n=1 Tax=Phenylobacterium sp. TaxID=1871053 RepID=UPI002F936C3F